MGLGSVKPNVHIKLSRGLVAGIVKVVARVDRSHVIRDLGIEVCLQWRIVFADIVLGRLDRILAKVMVLRSGSMIEYFNGNGLSNSESRRSRTRRDGEEGKRLPDGERRP